MIYSNKQSSFWWSCSLDRSSRESKKRRLREWEKSKKNKLDLWLILLVMSWWCHWRVCACVWYRNVSDVVVKRKLPGCVNSRRRWRERERGKRKRKGGESKRKRRGESESFNRSDLLDRLMSFVWLCRRAELEARRLREEEERRRLEEERRKKQEQEEADRKLAVSGCQCLKRGGGMSWLVLKSYVYM